MVQRLGHYDEMSNYDWKHLNVDMEKHGVYEMDRQNKKCNYARKSGRRKNNAGTHKEEEKKLAGPLAKKELPADEALEGMVNGKKVCSRRRYQMIDIIMINGLYADMKRKAEKRIEWRMLSLQ